MIANSKVEFPNSTQDKIRQFETSEFTFYLTGSRFFGGFSSNSDYDFFVQSNPEVVDFLKQIGFIREKDNYKDDPNIDSVYVCSCSPISIHIQLVKLAEIKQLAQEIIYNNFELRQVLQYNKATADLVWNSVISSLIYLSKKG